MNLKADAPFYEAAFNARLADKLLKEAMGLGGPIAISSLRACRAKLVEKFSKRTKQIEELARRHYTVLSARARALMKQTGMEFADAFAHAKGCLGGKSRKSKAEIAVSAEEQLASWRAQMTPEERESLRVESVKGSRTEK